MIFGHQLQSECGQNRKFIKNSVASGATKQTKGSFHLGDSLKKTPKKPKRKAKKPKSKKAKKPKAKKAAKPKRAAKPKAKRSAKPKKACSGCRINMPELFS